MPPRPSLAQRRTTQAEHIYEPGVVGRKTGVTVPDSGVRDEHGMEPIENLFSSPRKPDDEDEELEDEEDEEDWEPMELTTNIGPGPAALLNGHAATRFPQQSKSPTKTKTFLNSPAQRNKLIAKSASTASRSSSSPTDSRPQQSSSSSQPATSAAAFKRKLDFASLGKGGPHSLSQPTNGRSNGHRLQSLQQEEEDDGERSPEDEEVENFVDESLAMLSGNDDQPEPEPEPEMEEDSEDDNASMVGDDTMRLSAAAAQTKKKGGRPAKEKQPAAQLRPKTSAPAKPGRKPAMKVVEELEEEEEEEEEAAEEEEQAQEPTPKPQKAAASKRGRPAKANKPPTPEPAPAPVPAKRGRKRKSLEQEEGPAEEPSPEPQPKRKRGEPAAKASKKAAAPPPPPPPPPPPKRSVVGAAAAAAAKKNAAASPGPKATKATKPEPPAEKPKKRGRTRKSSIDPGDTSVVAIAKRPPLPKSRGLLINRRSEDPGNMFQTRSGRSSIKPLAWWRNEQVHYENDELVDNYVSKSSTGSSKFVIGKIKEVVRFDEPEPEDRPKPGRRGRKFKAASAGRPRRRSSIGEEDETPAEPWELNPGTVTGEVVVWQPEYEFAPPAPNDMVSVMDKQLAISGAAIKTTEVIGGEFRYAKVFSEGFIGAGVVDLPPGAIKRLKNSRKVFMIFFVHKGKCLVTVQETTFRIGKGGIFIVPRYNEYTIENDYDHPTRLFFSQGTEVAPQPGEGESTMMMANPVYTGGEQVTEGEEEEEEEEEEDSEEE
ncbi:putative centromere protein [Podospora australis]|uniref:CENP-C homolog n=1 Tax=Podospora australis TaxID=1536484 RepID=A0AAN6WUK2_9PEZI|nr:putative centromere protein [Podospora australis]